RSSLQPSSLTHGSLHAFPTRRSSDLRLVAEGNVGIAFEALGVLTGENYSTLAPLRNELPVSPPEPADRKHWEEMALSNNAQLKRSEEHTSELQSRENLVCRLLLEKKN